MARPLKKGLDYFSLDVSFYHDIKIRKLIRRKGGGALSVYTLLLCKIYEEGYYVRWDEDLPFIIFEVTGFEEVKIKDIIEYCVSIGLFDQRLFDEQQVLTSRGIQRRYFVACSLTKRKVNASLPYLLVDVSDKNDNSEKTDVYSEKTDISSEETGISSEETQENSEFSTQRKEKENKDNNSLRSSLSPSSPTPPARVCEGDARGSAESGGGASVSDGQYDVPLTAADGVVVLRGDRSWLLQMQRKFGIEASSLVIWLDRFVVDCDCRGKQQHASLSDVMQHFNDWLAVQASQKGGGKKGRHTAEHPSTPQQRWVRCIAELCHAVSAEECSSIFSLLSFVSYDASSSELYVQVPSMAVYDRLEKDYVALLSRVVPRYFGSNVKLFYLPKEVSSRGDGSSENK